MPTLGAGAQMTVEAEAHGTTPADWPTLAEQIAATGNVDPFLLGATGFVDDAFTVRLAGDVT